MVNKEVVDMDYRGFIRATDYIMVTNYIMATNFIMSKFAVDQADYHFYENQPGFNPLVLPLSISSKYIYSKYLIL